jgi:hypothetical protein
LSGYLGRVHPIEDVQIRCLRKALSSSMKFTFDTPCHLDQLCARVVCSTSISRQSGSRLALLRWVALTLPYKVGYSWSFVERDDSAEILDSVRTGPSDDFWREFFESTAGGTIPNLKSNRKTPVQPSK